MVSQNSDAQLYPLGHPPALASPWRDRSARPDRSSTLPAPARSAPFEVEDCEGEHAFSQVANHCRKLGHQPRPSTQTGRWLQRQRELSEAGSALEPRGPAPSEGGVRPARSPQVGQPARRPQRVDWLSLAQPFSRERSRAENVEIIWQPWVWERPRVRFDSGWTQAIGQARSLAIEPVRDPAQNRLEQGLQDGQNHKGQRIVPPAGVRILRSPP